MSKLVAIWPALLSVLFLGSTSSASVVVSPAAFATTEGNEVTLPTSAAPGGAPFLNGARLQQLNVAADFLAMGPGPFEIKQIAFRPDASVNLPVNTTWDLQINLSTTTRRYDTLDLTFGANHGANLTNVLDGIVTLQSDGIRNGGAPHDFDYQINLTTPFTYDPSQGNLMLEMRWRGTVNLAWLDSQNFRDGTSRSLFAEGTNTGVATVVSSALAITQFSSVPEPGSCALLGIAGACIAFRRRAGRPL